jgi:hypothetical protein
MTRLLFSVGVSLLAATTAFAGPITPAHQRQWSKIDGESSFQAMVKRSADKIVIFYKHSPTCGRCADVYENILTPFFASLTAEQRARFEIAYVDVIADKETNGVRPSRAGGTISFVSWLTERDLDVTHASPQIILIQKGRVIWEGNNGLGESSSDKITKEIFTAKINELRTVVSQGTGDQSKRDISP